MRIVDLSVRRPVTIFIFALAAVVFGTVAYQQLATDLLPDITYPSLTVRTEYEGAAPIEVESLVTRPVENAVGVVNNVVRTSSSSRADVSEVILEFRWGTNMDLAGLDVRERLDVLRLPDDAEQPVLLRYDPSLDPIVRIGLFGEKDLIRLRLLAEEDVKRTLERVEGVAAAVVSGGLEEEVQIELDETKIANLGLEPDRIVERLAQENVNLTGGRLRDGQTEFLVRTVGELVRPQDLGQIVIERSQGAVIRLVDVARLVRGSKERDIITRIDGQESVEVAIFKEGGTNTATVSAAVQEELEGLRERLASIDPALDLVVISDQARYIRQSVAEVLNTALWGGSLAILILFLFLRSWKTTSIIGIAIPISVVATFFLMYLSGVSLNIISLGGLTLGIGLLVDNSIVVLESIQRRRDEGLSETEAARVGASEVGKAVVASTLTTICVFAPIVFVEGIAGQLFGDQALTVTFSLVISLGVALTVIPMLASRKFRISGTEDETTGDARSATAETTDPEATQPGTDGSSPNGADDGDPLFDRPPGPLSRFGGMIGGAAFQIAVLFARLGKWLGRGIAAVVGLITWLPVKLFHTVFDVLPPAYERTLGWVLKRPFLTLLTAVLVLAASLSLYPRLGRELIPEMIQGEFFVNLELPPGTQLDVTQRRLSSLEQTAAQIPGVALVYGLAGTSNEQGGVAGEARENVAQLTLMLEPPISKEREEAAMAQLRQVMDRQDDLTYSFGRPSYFSFRTPIEVEIRGYNLRLLKRLSEDLASRFAEIPGLADVKSSTEGGNPELQILFDRERLATLNLSVGQIAQVVRTKVQGSVATDIQRDDRTIDIRVRADESDRDSVADLLRLTVAQRGRVAIPLTAVADVVEVEGPAEIRRSDGDRVAVITANLAGRDLASVSEDIEGILEATSWPSGFDWRLGGQRQEMETSFDSMRLAILLAIFMVYLVMASQFESLVHPFVILASVPFALIGVLLTLSFFGVTISIVVLIGVILLAGIVVNNAIILIDSTNQLRRSGLSKIEALRRAGATRLRPILMTTSTTFLGLLPMALGLGEGSELRTPMALTVIGGLLTSTFLTLLIVPAVYSLVDRGK